VLLLDEPLSNLDAKLRRRVRDDIRELQQKLNLTVAYVTHDQEEALAVSDRIIVMSNARIAQTGSPRELYEEPANLFVADFIGDANLVDAELLEERGDRALARFGQLELELPRRGAVSGPIKLAVRPDAIVIHRARPARAAIEARIAKAAYLGKHVEYTVASRMGELFVIDRAERQPVSPGTDVWLSFADQDVTIIPA
jgi:iron(III) transport system ATP-binding protein